MSFLPKDYEAPKAESQYTKIEDGETRLRVLSKPLLGWEEWSLDKKVRRFPFDQKPEKKDWLVPTQPPRHFWSLIVWNYQKTQIEIWHITQNSIKSRLEGLYHDSDWGEPWKYDIKIFKSGEGKDTKYLINPVPHKEVSKEIIEAFKSKPIYLPYLLTGKDPFYYEGLKTPLMNEEGDEVSFVAKKHKEGCITPDQINTLEGLLKVDAEYAAKLQEHLDSKDIQSIDEIPTELYPSIYEMAMENFKKKLGVA